MDSKEELEARRREMTEYKARKAKDPYHIDYDKYETTEELYAALDKMFPKMAEPDEEGIGLHPADPRRRFIAVAAGSTFRKADPLTEEDLAEFARMKKMLNIEDDK